MEKPKLLIIDWKTGLGEFKRNLEHWVGEDAELLLFSDVDTISKEAKEKGFGAIVLHPNEDVREARFLGDYKNIPKYLFVPRGMETLKETHQLLLGNGVVDGFGDIQYFDSDYCGVIRKAIDGLVTQS